MRPLSRLQTTATSNYSVTTDDGQIRSKALKLPGSTSHQAQSTTFHHSSRPIGQTRAGTPDALCPSLVICSSTHEPNQPPSACVSAFNPHRPYCYVPLSASLLKRHEFKLPACVRVILGGSLRHPLCLRHAGANLEIFRANEAFINGRDYN